ncbi:MAG: hypothetical protein AAFV88_02765 [Planctomycetota bacterium]
MKKSAGSTGFSLKDKLFNRERVGYLAGLLVSGIDGFEKKRFEQQAIRGLKKLELKERIRHLAAVVEQHLDSDFTKACDQIVNSLPPPLDPSKTDDDFGDFIFAPFGTFVANQGLTRKHRRTAMRTLRELTMRFSMEDSIRAFINAFPDETFKDLTRWAEHSNYHVRRLVSEGTRPTLPWSCRLKTDPVRALPLLDHLHGDPTRYVTRSVANHLNDIAKIDPAAVLQRLDHWKSAKRQTPDELHWLTKHALRTLIKDGHPTALRRIGFQKRPKIELSSVSLLPPAVRPGEAVHLEFTITAKKASSLLIDYVIDFVKANEKRSSKVFKITEVHLEAGEQRVIKKRHPFRAGATTFTLYPGTHYLTLQINGEHYDRLPFEMKSGAK